MPIKFAAVRQIRKDAKRAVRNSALRSELKTLIKRLHHLVEGKHAKEARALLPLVAKKYDHAASKGVIHRNTAARYKSRLSRQVNGLGT